MNDSKIVRFAFLHSVGVVAYIALVAFVMSRGEQWFGQAEQANKILIPIAMLLLFVFSAAVVGSLVFLRAILWYMNGQNPEAVKLFAYTVGWLFVFVLASFFVLSIQ